jgi:GNAT superfamily N-acetyltransferase
MPAEGALERATREQESLLPQGLETPGHDLFVGTVDGEEVGLVWQFTDPELTIPETFVYAMDVIETYRGRGHGRELLEATERWCAEQGVRTMRLHVFDDNLAAVGLYETSGFETSSRTMSKQIR